MQQIIYASARGEGSGGEGSGGEDDFSSPFLNDSGEGLQFEDEVTLTTNSVEDSNVSIVKCFGNFPGSDEAIKF